MNAISSRNNFLPEVSLSRGVPRGHVCNKVGRFHGFRLRPSFADNFERKVKPPVFFVLHGFPSRDNHSRIISLIAHVVVTLSLFKFARLPYSVSFFLHDRNKERERREESSRFLVLGSERDFLGSRSPNGPEPSLVQRKLLLLLLLCWPDVNGPPNFAWQRGHASHPRVTSSRR